MVVCDLVLKMCKNGRLSRNFEDVTSCFFMLLLPLSSDVFLPLSCLSFSLTLTFRYFLVAVFFLLYFIIFVDISCFFRNVTLNFKVASVWDSACLYYS